MKPNTRDGVGEWGRGGVGWACRSETQHHQQVHRVADRSGIVLCFYGGLSAHQDL